MTDCTRHHDGTRDRSDPRSLADPESLRERSDVAFAATTKAHDDREARVADREGRAVVGVTDADGDLLVLSNPERSVALLPHGRVDPGADWAVAARRGVEGQTGVAIALDGVDAVREVAHVLAGESTPYARTFHVRFAGSPVGGEIQPCKRTPDAGSDGWTADWVDALPEGVAGPEGPAADDLRAFLEGD